MKTNKISLSQSIDISTQITALKPYQKVNEDTGEITNKYKYLPGRPKQYRFDAKEGV